MPCISVTWKTDMNGTGVLSWVKQLTSSHKDGPSEHHPIPSFLLCPLGDSRPGKPSYLDWFSLLCCLSDCPPGEHYNPVYNSGWAYSPSAHVLFLGNVGLHWPKPVHCHYPQDAGHLLVQFKGNSFWCLSCTDVYDSSVLWSGVWGTDSNGHRPLCSYMQSS